MITRRVKIQLLVFLVITLVGVTYVGARYARLDRIFFDDTYTVVAHYGANSGGIYAGGEVTYRGVRIGQVDKLEVTRDGVDVFLSIEKDHDRIPSDALALVGNRSALGEQYVEIQPLKDEGPYLKEDSEISLTQVPIATSKLLKDVSTTVASVDEEHLRTSVHELGVAFNGTGEDLAQIIDTSNSFIEAANENFDVTTALIRDSNVVLRGQLDKASAIRSFARDLSLFSGTLRASDTDLRRLIQTGTVGAQTLRRFLEQNGVELSDLMRNLTTSGEVVVKHLEKVEMVLSIYPRMLEGAFSVPVRNADGTWDASFGLIMTEAPPSCREGYGGSERPATNGEYWKMQMDARCTEAITKSNPRGAQNAPGRSATGPAIGTYDARTGTFTWADDAPAVPEVPTTSTTVAPTTLGSDTWKWLLLQPLTLPTE